MGGGLAAAGAVSAVVTLALTHRSAVRENAAAYVNGHEDGYAHGFLDCVAMFCTSASAVVFTEEGD